VIEKNVIKRGDTTQFSVIALSAVNTLGSSKI
jgi:hypothetical protein